MSQDYLGNPLDTDHPATVAAIDDFVAGMLGYLPKAEGILAAADADADSRLVNALAGVLLMFSESPEGPALADRLLQRALVAQRRNPRSDSYARLLAAWIDDDIQQVLRLSGELLDHYPRDLFAAKLNQYLQFNRGDWPALLRIGLQARRGAPDSAHSHAMLAFAFEQCHLLDQAEASARVALSLQADEPWAQHALAHVMLTRGRIEEGIDFLHSVQAGWAPLNSFMYTHNWWHLALFHLARGDDARVLEIYDHHVWGRVPAYSQDQIGAISLLTRIELAGIDPGPRWAALLPYLLQRLEDTVQPFLSVQYLYGLARAGAPEADVLLANLRRHGQAAPAHSRAAWAEVSLPLAEAVLAHARGDYTGSLRSFAVALPRLNEIGGSHAQRDLFALIELDARLHAGDWLAAQQLLELRRGYDALDVPGNRQLARVYTALELPELAEQAQARVSAVLSRRAPGARPGQ